MDLRILHRGDEAALERFLARHADSSMILRANARAVGLEDRGEAMQGTYAAGFEGGEIVAVASHYWNGFLFLQAPRDTEATASAAVAASGRRVSGLAGPWAQVCAAREALGLATAPAGKAEREDLFALELASLDVPPALAEGRLTCHRSRDVDLDVLTAWRVAYGDELRFRVANDPLALKEARESIERLHARGDLFLLLAGGAHVATSSFNARLPDVVQVGGVFTPVALRGRGYARAVVAGSLLAARDEGVTHSVLFTSHSNAPAQRAYAALGYRIIGEFGLIVFP